MSFQPGAVTFGMLGAGTASRAIAGHAIRAGHDVVFSNSRGPETLADVVDRFALSMGRLMQSTAP